MKVSLILTVLNEGESIRGVLDSLAAQTRPPDEIVIADGGSRDNTVAILREVAASGRLPLRVIETPGANISQGRNAAIRLTTGEIIAATDAGVRCAPDWLEKLTAPFARAEGTPDQVKVVAGFFRPDVRNVFEIAMGATVLPEARDVNPKTYLPSSRSVAFLKSAWETVGGYPEWIDYCEDVIFDLKLRRQAGAFVFAPEAVVYFRPRGTLRAFARQYYLYARGDGKANLFWRQHAVRYFSYLIVAPLLVYAALAVSPWLWLLGALAGLAYVRVPLRRLWPQLAALPWPDRIRALVYVPVIRIVGDVAKMLGYPAGWAWRLRTGRRGWE
jgi:glycosyltransferase involved in cell wall biosynthesis